MAFITFITTYKPIVCGIADYSHFIVRECPPGSCDILSFDLDNFGVPLHEEPVKLIHPVRYSISSRDEFSARSILQGLRKHEDQVLWFQHEFGIWRENARFIKMLRDLNNIKVVSLHSLHFQRSETPYGLRRQEFSFLNSLLPHTDAITVFSNSVYDAVTHAFPEYSDKVHLLRHGTHLYPKIARMSRATAKARIYEYLINESGLDQASKDNLRQQRLFLDQDITVIGGVGFITASKGIKRLYEARNRLQETLPQRKIAAVHVGFLREEDSNIDSKYAAELRAGYNGEEQFFLETYVRGDMLPVLFRALDAYFYWPSDCTQSGILAHALGAGAVIACRDMEGVGETVRLAGGLACIDFEQLIVGLKELILNSKLRDEMSQRAVKFAKRFSWANQSLQHFELSEQLCRSKVKRLVPSLPLGADTIPSRQRAMHKRYADPARVGLV